MRHLPRLWSRRWLVGPTIVLPLLVLAAVFSLRLTDVSAQSPTVAIDVNPTGNTANLVGFIDPCIDIDVSGGAVDFTVDFVVTNAPAMGSVDFDLGFTDTSNATLSVVSTST